MLKLQVSANPLQERGSFLSAVQQDGEDIPKVDTSSQYLVP
jgi:hypothetical protein